MSSFGGKLYTEQPNQNQNTFGPSNQSSTFESPNQSQNQGASGVNNQALAPSFANPGTQIQQPAQPGWGTPPSSQTGALPWQNNNTQPSVSNPSWNVGHDGTQNNMNRDQYRDSWMSSGVSNNQMMDQWLAQNGGQRLNDAGVVRTPYGEILDMGMAFKTGSGKPAWTDIGMNNLGPNQGFSGPTQMPPLGFGGPGGMTTRQGINEQGGQRLAVQGPNGQSPWSSNPGQLPMQPGGIPPLQQSSNYFNGMNPGQNQQMDISSLTGPSFYSGNKYGIMPGQQSQMPGRFDQLASKAGVGQGQWLGGTGYGSRFGTTDQGINEQGGQRLAVQGPGGQSPWSSRGGPLSSILNTNGQASNLTDLAQQYQQSPEQIRQQDERNIRAGAPGPGYVQNGWGGWITRERAEEMRRSGAMS